MGGILSLLHIDDSEDFLSLFRDKISAFLPGIYIVSVKSSLGALSIAEQVRFDAVVADYDLPDMNGIELLKELRIRKYDGAFILLTGQGREEIASMALHLGADYYYQKDSGKNFFKAIAGALQTAVLKHSPLKSKSDSYNHHYSLYEKLPATIYELDKNGIIVSVNPAFERFSEYKFEEVIGKPLKDFVDTSDCTNWEQLLEGTWHETTREIIEAKPSGELCFKTKSGRRKKCFVQVLFNFRAGRRPTRRYLSGITGVVSDISEIRSVSDSARYKVFFDYIQEGVFIIKDRIIECNKFASRIFGYERDEMIGRRFIELSPKRQSGEDLSARTLRKYREKAAAGIEQGFSWFFTHKDGRLIDCEVSLTRVDYGDEFFLQVMVRDVTERNIIVRDIEKSESRYRQFADNINAGACFIKNERIVFANKRMANMLGYESADDILWCKLFDLLDTKDRARFKEEVNSNEKLPWIGYFNFIGKDKSRIRLTVCVSGSDFADEPVITITCIESYQKEDERIGKSIDLVQLNRFFNNFPGRLFELDLKGRIVNLNRSAEHFVQNIGQKVVWCSFFMLLNAQSTRSARKGFEQVLLGSQAIFEGMFKKALTVVEFRMMPGYNEDGAISSVYVWAEDITDKVGVEESFITSGKSYHNLVEVAHEGIAMVDPYEKIIYSNPAFAGMLGYSAAEIVGLNLQDFLRPDQCEKVTRETKKRKRGISSRYNLEMFTKTGEKKKVQISVSPLKDFMGKFQGGVAVVTDMTERERIAENLHLVNKRLTVLQEIIRITHQKISLKEMLQKTLSSVVSLMGHKGGAVFLFDDGIESGPYVRKGINRELFERLFSIEFDKRPFLRIKEGDIVKYPSEIPNSLFLPLSSEGDVLGCLALFQKKSGQQVNLDDEYALKSAAGEIADGIRRYRYEDELKEAVRKYKRLFDQMSVGIILLDKNFRIVEFNKAAEKLTGYQHNELSGLSIEDLSGQIMYRSPKNLVLKAEEVITHLHKLRRKDGKILDVLNTSMPISDLSGKIIGYQTVLLDRTEEIESVNRLNHLNNLLRGINLIAEELHTDKPLEERLDFVVYASKVHLGIDYSMIWLVVPAEEPSVSTGNTNINIKSRLDSGFGKNTLSLTSFYPLEAAVLVDTTSEKSSALKDLTNVEISEKAEIAREEDKFLFYPFKEEEVKKAGIKSISAYALHGLKGEILGVFTVLNCRPVSREMEDVYKSLAELIGRVVIESRTNEALKESLSNYRYLYETALSGIYRTTIKDGTFLSANQAAAEIFGYASPEELIKKCKASRLYSASERAKFISLLEKKRRVRDYEIRATLEDGRDVDLLINARIFKDKGYIEGTITDITRLKMLETGLKQKNTELEEFIYSVSHDLKAPLFSIGGYTDLLTKPGIEAEKRQEFLRSIDRNAREMTIFISKLLDLSKSGKVLDEINDIPVRKLIDGIFSEVRFSEISAELSHTGLPDIIRANYRIKEVFQNLITNAIQAKKANDNIRINISCRQFGGMWEFTVQDNGLGISQQNLNKIFLPGFTTRSGRIPGSGFGLSIVKRIIEAHRGTIRAESTLGIGSKFIFTLPKNIDIEYKY